LNTQQIPGGFMPEAYSGEIVASQPIFTQRNQTIGDPAAIARAMEADIKRASVTGDFSQILQQLSMNKTQLERAITSSGWTYATSGPVRENLEAEAKILVPLDTPVRNLLPRTMGSGLASKWKQLTSLGGGYGVNTTINGTAASATQTLVSTAGIQKGDTLYFGTAAVSQVVNSITNATTVVLAGSVSATNGETVTKLFFEPGTGVGALQAFFGESGAPAQHSSVYADQTAAYKLMGVLGGVTNFAMAAGSTFQNQLAIEKRNALINLMLNEENALINGDATDVKAPWGDGSNAYAFNGLKNLVTTANGTPADQVQAAVGALTTAHLDNQLRRLYNQGARGMFILMNPVEILSLVHLAEGAGSVIRVTASSATGATVLGVTVSGYVHPVTGEVVPIYASRFLQSGTIIFGSRQLPDGSPSADVQVLPQVQLPQSAFATSPGANYQGYVAQELAPTAAAPGVFSFLVSVYETVRLKSALHWALSSGVTAV
jgi:hypothetical protein